MSDLVAFVLPASAEADQIPCLTTISAMRALTPGLHARKCQENTQALDTGAGGDVTINTIPRPDRIEAQSKWEMSVELRKENCGLRVF